MQLYTTSTCQHAYTQPLHELRPCFPAHAYTHILLHALAKSLSTHSPLPTTNPCIGTPAEVIEAVAQGIDLVDTTYPLMATNAGWALSFAVDPVLDGGASDASGSPSAANPTPVVNLWSREYAEDGRPLVEGCECFACRGYTRAYVHHLLETHEMLAGVLLEMHNTYHWLGFMEAMRRAIVEGRFEKWKAAMLPAV